MFAFFLEIINISMIYYPSGLEVVVLKKKEKDKKIKFGGTVYDQELLKKIQ